MQTKRTVILFPDAMREFAELHGAVFDETTGDWVVLGEVPNELLQFIPRAPRTRDYVGDSVADRCGCGHVKVLRYNRMTGRSAWSCSDLRCKSVKSIEFIPVPGFGASGINSIETVSPPIDFQSRARAQAIVMRTIEEFRDPEAATRWLKAPKVSLNGKGKTPLEAIKTVDGCAAVEKLLDELFGE